MTWSDWTTVWLVVAVVGAAVGAAALVLYRRERGRAVPSLGRATCHYLDRDLVMNLYRQGSPGLRREIEQTVQRERRLDVGAGAGGLRVGAGRDRMEQLVVKFVDEAEPITVIQLIIESLNRNGRLIHVDVANRTAELNEVAGQGDRRAVRLSELPGLEHYCMFTGRFRRELGGDEIRLTADFGAASLSVRCRDSEEIIPVPADEPFNASCLGRVQRWSERSGSLVVDPVLAVFL
jgi:hypothetical protein